MHIVLTRPIEDSLELMRNLKIINHVVTHLPLINIKGILNKNINFDNCKGIIFTSANAIKFLNTKNISKNIVTVLGGVYAMANPTRAMKDKNLDYVVIGEGEYVFKQLIGFYSGVCDLPERGICFRKDGTGELENRGHSEFIKNLDDLPRPAYHLIDFLAYYNKYNDRKGVDRPATFPYVRIITSRGCPEKCSFCQVPSLQGSYFRQRSPDNVCDEIEWLKKEYGIKAILFDDDNMFTNTKRGKALLRRMIAVSYTHLTLPTNREV